MAMYKAAKSKNETMLVDFYFLLISEIESNNAESDTSFDVILSKFIENRVKTLNKNYKKTEQRFIDQEIYLLSLLSYSFLDAKLKIVIDNKKVVINTDE